MTALPVGFDPLEYERVAFAGPVVQTVNAPAAGADWSVVPSTAMLVKVRSVVGQLVTSTHVATRYPSVEFLDANGDVIVAAPGPATQAASLTGVDCWGIGMAPMAVVVSFQSAPLPNLWLPPGAKVQSSTGSIDAADQWSAVVLTYDLLPYFPRG